MSLGPNSVKITFFSIFLQNSLIARRSHELGVLAPFGVDLRVLLKLAQQQHMKKTYISFCQYFY